MIVERRVVCRWSWDQARWIAIAYRQRVLWFGRKARRDG